MKGDGCLLGCSVVHVIVYRLRALMMEAASTAETPVNLYQTTRRYNLEDSCLLSHFAQFSSGPAEKFVNLPLLLYCVFENFS
jgi:hypothetical protein